MRCKICDYRLWNLKSRRCPECGTSFLPSDYEFVPNSVRFCCPHCDQAYFGTGEKGHLVPEAFDCVSCGTHIEMDEMVVLPAEGVREEQTKVFRMPWLERKERGRVRAWFSTIGMALVAPIKLTRALSEDSSTAQAWWFAILTTSMIMAVAAFAFLPFMLLPLLLAPGTPGGGATGLFFPVTIAVLVVVQVFVMLLAMGLWGLVTHGLLYLTGRTASGMGRTFQAICYSSGANVGTAIPCMGWYFGWIWWVVSAVLMVKEGQRVHGGRAAFAVLTLPGLGILTFAGLYVGFMIFAFSVAQKATTATVSVTSPSVLTSETQTVLDAVQRYAGWNAGRGPDHAIQLVTQDYLAGSDLVSVHSMTVEEDVPVADATLGRFSSLPASLTHRDVQAAIDALPEQTVAHRLGDFVFTYHGVDFNRADPRLWIVIMWPDPDANLPASPGATVAVGQADGTVQPIPMSLFYTRLAAQDVLRAQYNLPPLPGPTTVTHARPAVSGP